MTRFLSLVSVAALAAGCATQGAAQGPAQSAPTTDNQGSAATIADPASPAAAPAPAAELSGAPRSAGEKITFPYVETFEGHAPDVSPLGWQDKGDEKATSKVVGAGTVTPKSGTQMLHLSDNSPGDAAQISTLIGPAGKGSVQFSFYDDSDNPADNYMTLGVGTHSDGRVVDILFTASGNIRYRADTGDLVTIGAYSFDEWHDVSIIFDVAQGSFWFFLDGVRLDAFPLVQASPPSHLTFKVGSNSKSGQSAFIDDIQVVLE